MVDCRESKHRYRHDQVQGRWVEYHGQRIFVASEASGSEGQTDRQQKAMKFFDLRAKNADEMQWDGRAALAARRQEYRQSSLAQMPRRWAR